MEKRLHIVVYLFLVLLAWGCGKDVIGEVQVPDPPAPEQVLPEEPETGYRIYTLNRSGWTPCYLYLYGDVNDLVGAWPGLPVTGTVALGDYSYDYFDLPENVHGRYEYLEFNNIDEKHVRENRPHLRFGEQRVYWFLLEADTATEIADPFHPGTDPVPDPGGDDGDDADDVDWPAAVSYVFDGSVVPEIHLTVTESEWNRLLAAYDQNHDTQEYITCDVRYVKGGDTWSIAGAGLRLKGNTSRRRPESSQTHSTSNPDWHHVHFGLDFHKNVKDTDHTVKGLRKVDLKWFKDDPMYVREVYCYDLFRRYGVWTGIRDVYARLWLKVGESREAYFGVYGMLEHIDKNYVRTRKESFGSKGGNLWKCRYGADLKNVEADFGVDDNVHDHVYELKTNTASGFPAAKAQLQDFIRNLGSLSGTAFNEWIASVTDVDLLLKTYAVNVAVGMWDDYWNNSNNYYIYFNSTEKSAYRFFFIPYDYDNTLGTSSNCGVQGDAGRQDPYRWGQDNHPLLVKVLQNPVWKAKYKACLQELCGDGGLSSYAVAAPRIRAWQSSVSAFISNDTGEDMSISDRPAGWGNHPEYRLLETGSDNFFQVKSATVAAMK
ncbi:MAG: CotH kinase family protein [Bacteroidales bacterium]|nr:CotH kinase family protein [Bacteroidales bacterium]